MIHQAKSNPQLLDEQIFSGRSHPLFLLFGTFATCRPHRAMSASGVTRKNMEVLPHLHFVQGAVTNIPIWFANYL
jgi:hypothetical protein